MFFCRIAFAIQLYTGMGKSLKAKTIQDFLHLLGFFALLCFGCVGFFCCCFCLVCYFFSLNCVETWIMTLIRFSLRNKIRFCILSGTSYGQLQIYSHSICDRLPIKSLMFVFFNNCLAYISRAYLISLGELQIQASGLFTCTHWRCRGA